MTKSRNILPPRIFWSESQLATLRERYPHEKTEHLVSAIGRDLKSIYSKASELDLKKSAEFLASSAETQFKPGNRSGVALEIYQPIGTERISKEGYIQRKINDDMPFHKRWRGVHILNWEAVNGPLPSGHALTFRDGNKQNTALDNLELVSRAALMRKNSFHNYGKEITQIVQLRSAISRLINKRKGIKA